MRSDAPRLVASHRILALPRILLAAANPPGDARGNAHSFRSFFARGASPAACWRGSWSFRRARHGAALGLGLLPLSLRRSR